MKNSIYSLIPFLGCLLLAAGCVNSTRSEMASEFKNSVPVFTVDPFWPKPLANNWLIGQVGGVAIDSKDHIWIIHRPKSLGKEETDASPFPPEEFSISPAPPVMEFDPDGNMVQAWGGPGKGYEWPETEHGIFVDHEDNVWINGGGPGGHLVLKFRRDGTFLFQIGKAAKPDRAMDIVPLASSSQASASRGAEPRNNDTTQVGFPTDFAVDRATNEVYVADGYENHRVIVFDATTGKYKRHWGAYGKEPYDFEGSYNPGYPPSQRNPADPGIPPSEHFTTVHGIGISKDGSVYVCDRSNNRIQVFEKNGKYLREGFIATGTLGYGSVWDIAFSHDPQQTFVYVSDGTNNCVRILRRENLKMIGHFGRIGRYAGQFIGLHSIAADSRGNIYTGEVFSGKRIQKFVLSGNSSTVCLRNIID